MRHRRARDAGFSLIETLVSMALLAIALGGFFQFVIQGQRVTRSQPDAADLQQRVRVAADTIQRDLAMAGAGAGGASGTLIDHMPAVMPVRFGVRNTDPELSFFSDRITVMYVPRGAVATRLTADMPSAAADIPIDVATAGCPSAGLCGFVPGLHALILQADGPGAGYNLFAVSGTTGGLAHGPPDPAFSRAYAAASAVVMPIVRRVYYLDAVNRRLMQYDGHQSDLPLVDHVVALRFTYYADPSPASVSAPADGTSNCAFAADSPPLPLLADLGGTALQPVGAGELTDGPFCGIAPFRFDADLLRIRRVTVTIRAQVAADDLRGSGAGFANAGRSTTGLTYVPDYELSFDVAPRSMHPSR